MRREPTSGACWCRLDQKVRPLREGTVLDLICELMQNLEGPTLDIAEFLSFRLIAPGITADFVNHNIAGGCNFP